MLGKGEGGTQTRGLKRNEEAVIAGTSCEAGDLISCLSFVGIKWKTALFFVNSREGSRVAGLYYYSVLVCSSTPLLDS